MRFGQDSEIERIIEARVAIRAQAQAIHWRLRLILVESGMLAMTILVAGGLMGQPLGRILGSALLVAAGCLSSGLLLVGLSGGASIAVSRVCRWKANRDAMARWVKRP
jgi:hypothetical protein